VVIGSYRAESENSDMTMIIHSSSGFLFRKENPVMKSAHLPGFSFSEKNMFKSGRAQISTLPSIHSEPDLSKCFTESIIIDNNPSVPSIRPCKYVAFVDEKLFRFLNYGCSKNGIKECSFFRCFLRCHGFWRTCGWNVIVVQRNQLGYGRFLIHWGRDA